MRTCGCVAENYSLREGSGIHDTARTHNSNSISRTRKHADSGTQHAAIYARVSTTDQDVDRQLDDVREYLADQDVDEIAGYPEVVSGAVDTDTRDVYTDLLDDVAADTGLAASTLRTLEDDRRHLYLGGEADDDRLDAALEDVRPLDALREDDQGLADLRERVARPEEKVGVE